MITFFTCVNTDSINLKTYFLFNYYTYLEKYNITNFLSNSFFFHSLKDLCGRALTLSRWKKDEKLAHPCDLPSQAANELRINIFERRNVKAK